MYFLGMTQTTINKLNFFPFQLLNKNLQNFLLHILKHITYTETHTNYRCMSLLVLYELIMYKLYAIFHNIVLYFNFKICL